MTASLVGGYLPCPVALKLAKRLNVDARAVGDTVDELGIRITDCQLGCFKVEKASHEDLVGKVIREEITERVRGSLVRGGLPCPVAHDLGRELKVSIKEIGDAATRMKIKIIDCQLNCFA
ncbi:MAG: hypothetical protein A2Z05_02835 [Chloroflexi bacterium RBG_16_60_22]|nr:MAG: hypothetical protein A2Z05_02835 [Chloroflexi bacterium RBG_16_60_22]